MLTTVVSAAAGLALMVALVVLSEYLAERLTSAGPPPRRPVHR